MSPKGIGEVIKALREAKGLSQVDLAASAKVERSYVVKLESGDKANPSLSVLGRLARALGTTVTHLSSRAARPRRPKVQNVARPVGIEHLRHEYFRTALEYHAAARFAALSAFMPMSGVLFHHALELYLKGHLCTSLTEPERKHLGHDLRRLWKRYKRLAGDPDLNRFDVTIADVDRFEQVRYPDRIVERGIRTAITFSRGEFSDQSTPTRSEPLYVVTVDEIDALVAVLWRASRLNPSAFITRYKAAPLSYLDQFNKSRFW